MSEQQEEQSGSGDDNKKRVTLPEIADTTAQMSPRSKKRINKLYRTPPTPDMGVQFEREKSFVLDSVAVCAMQNDFFGTNPKVGAVIFPYNAQKDKHCKNYFTTPTVPKVLKKTGQLADGGTAIGGVSAERFHNTGYLSRYFSSRNASGIGHSIDSISGHHSNSTSAKPVIGYNGQFGFRRNTPDLRQAPSPFGIQSRGLPLY